MDEETPSDLTKALHDALAANGPSEPPPLDVNALWQSAKPRVEAARFKHRNANRARLLPLVGWASLAMILSVGFALLGHRASAPQGHGMPRSYITRAGERLSVTLVDGTQLTLAPESRVQVAANYANGDRGVELDGEAYFAVVHNSRHPFSVHADGTTLTDVGTRFDVRRYEGDRDVRVAVAEGAVAVQGGPTLRANDMATVGESAIAVTHDADVSAFTAWRQGQLIFRNTPLAVVVRDLSRTFGLTVRLADSTLGTLPVTGAFGHDSASEVLDEVTQVIGLTYRRVGQTVVIRRDLANARQGKAAAPPPLRTAQSAVKDALP